MTPRTSAQPTRAHTGAARRGFAAGGGPARSRAERCFLGIGVGSDLRALDEPGGDRAEQPSGLVVRAAVAFNPERVVAALDLVQPRPPPELLHGRLEQSPPRERILGPLEEQHRGVDVGEVGVADVLWLA